MGLFERVRPEGALAGAEREALLDELVARRASLLLATPYLSVEARLVERTGEILRLRVPLGEAAARHVLSQKPLRLRLPWANSMVAGETILLGTEREDSRLRLRVSAPTWLAPDERRRVPRVERISDLRGGLALSDGRLLRVRIEDLAERGAGVLVLEPIGPSAGLRGRLSVPLEGGPDLNLSVRVVQGDEPLLGLQFDPPPGGRDLERLRAWLAPRLEEARRRWENRAELRARAEAALKPKVPPAGVLVLSGRAELAAELGPVLEGVEPLRSVAPAMAPWKEALDQQPPRLVLAEAPADSEARRRLKLLLEAAPPGCPILLLGEAELRPEDRAWALTLKPEAILAWSPAETDFLRRWVQGLLRRAEGGLRPPGGSGPEGGTAPE